MERSPLPPRLWGWAIYLEMTSLKGVSSVELHRELGGHGRPVHRPHAPRDRRYEPDGGRASPDQHIVVAMIGKRPTYPALAADNGQLAVAG